MRMFLYRLRILGLKLFFMLYVLVYALTFAPVLQWMRFRGRQARVEEIVSSVAVSFFQRVFRMLDCEVRVEGAENIPKERGFVVMVNHQSKFDIPLLGGYLGKPLGFVAKKELFRIPGISFWMRRIDCMPLDRSNVARGAAALGELAVKLKEHRRGFIIFPEGTRTRDPDGTVQDFRQGSLRIASEHQLPVLPISLDGTRFLDQSRSLWASRRGGRYVRLKIAPLQEVQAGSAPERKAFMTQLRETIVANRESILVSWPEGT